MTLKTVTDLKPFDVASIGFEKQFGVPRFEIDTKDDVHALWIPVAHRTRLYFLILGACILASSVANLCVCACKSVGMYNK